MDTAVINIRTSKTLKTQAQDVAEKLGFSLSSLINAYLQQLVRTKRVEVSLEEKPNAYLRKILDQADKDYKKGKGVRFDNPQDAIDYLDKLMQSSKDED
jgi:addiction module RelB/DinJ family antitoxin